LPKHSDLKIQIPQSDHQSKLGSPNKPPLVLKRRERTKHSESISTAPKTQVSNIPPVKVTEKLSHIVDEIPEKKEPEEKKPNFKKVNLIRPVTAKKNR
jgi:hypothetical protein